MNHSILNNNLPQHNTYKNWTRDVPKRPDMKKTAINFLLMQK